MAPAKPGRTIRADLRRGDMCRHDGTKLERAGGRDVLNALRLIRIKR